MPAATSTPSQQRPEQLVTASGLSTPAVDRSEAGKRGHMAERAGVMSSCLNEAKSQAQRFPERPEASPCAVLSSRQRGFVSWRRTVCFVSEKILFEVEVLQFVPRCGFANPASATPCVTRGLPPSGSVADSFLDFISITSALLS